MLKLNKELQFFTYCYLKTTNTLVLCSLRKSECLQAFFIVANLCSPLETERPFRIVTPRADSKNRPSTHL